MFFPTIFPLLTDKNGVNNVMGFTEWLSDFGKLLKLQEKKNGRVFTLTP
jgi:hypothetical protein